MSGMLIWYVRYADITSVVDILLQASFETNLERKFQGLGQSDSDCHFTLVSTHQVQEILNDLQEIKI